MQPVSVWVVEGGAAGMQRPFGSILQPVLSHALVRKLQPRPRRSRNAEVVASARRGLSNRGLAVEAQGKARSAASRRRTVLRRNEEIGMATPWRALRHGPPWTARARLRTKVDQITIP